MAEDSTIEKEDLLNKKITRRAVLGGVAAAGAVAGAAVVEKQTGALSKTAGALGRALEGFFNRPTEQQLEAAQQLDREDVPKTDYQVKTDNPDIQQVGGVTVRKQPGVPLSGEPATGMYLLKPGEKISGITWRGKDPFNVNKDERTAWVAFKNEKGQVGFVAERYLERAKQPVNPSP